MDGADDQGQQLQGTWRLGSRRRHWTGFPVTVKPMLNPLMRTCQPAEKEERKPLHLRFRPSTCESASDCETGSTDPRCTALADPGRSRLLWAAATTRQASGEGNRDVARVGRDRPNPGTAILRSTAEKTNISLEHSASLTEIERLFGGCDPGVSMPSGASLFSAMPPRAVPSCGILPLGCPITARRRRGNCPRLLVRAYKQVGGTRLGVEEPTRQERT